MCVCVCVYLYVYIREWDFSVIRPKTVTRGDDDDYDVDDSGGGLPTARRCVVMEEGVGVVD